MNKLFLEKILFGIRKNSLIANGDSILIALSGGADSVALLHSLSFLKDKFQLQLYALHVHHGIRAKADQDAKFSKIISEHYGIPCFIEYIDTPKIALENKISLESAGRLERYKIFASKATELNANKIATGHHLSDQAETLLMRIVRGTGTAGFAGILPLKGDKIIRPLLTVSRSEITALLRNLKIPYIEDETNFDTDYTRNKIRRQIIPVIEELNPSFAKNITQMGEILKDENSFLEEITRKLYSDLLVREQSQEGIAMKYFSTLHIALQRRVIRLYISSLTGSKLDISFQESEKILNHLNSGKTEISVKTGNLFLYKNNNFFSLSLTGQTNQKIDKQYKITGEGEFHLKEFNLTLKIHRTQEKPKIADSPFRAVIDEDKTEMPLKVRTRKNGDRFHPLGLNGSKKIKDFFIECKIPKYVRDSVPILTDQKDDILWIIGHRLDNRVRITQKTMNYLILTVSEMGEH